ncbi:GNAT family N-acetyltransferase, partial [Sphingomonas endophytica]
ADTERMARMIANANLIVTARKAHQLVGVSRALTDFAYCCYLSDLAVDRQYQGHGIGKRLIAETRRFAGPESMCLLLSAPDSIGFYKTIGMPQPDNAFLYKRER